MRFSRRTALIASIWQCLGLRAMSQATGTDEQTPAGDYIDAHVHVWTADVADVRQLCDLAKHRHTYVKLSAFYFLGEKRPPYADVLRLLRRLIAAFEPQRLMWATDSPFQVQSPHSYQASLELIRDRLDGVSQSDRQWILGRTAASLFFT